MIVKEEVKEEEKEEETANEEVRRKSYCLVNCDCIFTTNTMSISLLVLQPNTTTTTTPLPYRISLLLPPQSSQSYPRMSRWCSVTLQRDRVYWSLWES